MPDGTAPRTPDGRYLVVRGRLWRASNPDLAAGTRARLVAELMDARRAVGTALRAHDRTAETVARAAVDDAKRKLGERGPVWWTDGAPDYNRHMARNTPYATWYADVADIANEAGAVQANASAQVPPWIHKRVGSASVRQGTI